MNRSIVCIWVNIHDQQWTKEWILKSQVWIFIVAPVRKCSSAIPPTWLRSRLYWCYWQYFTGKRRSLKIWNRPLDHYIHLVCAWRCGWGFLIYFLSYPIKTEDCPTADVPRAVDHWFLSELLLCSAEQAPPPPSSLSPTACDRCSRFTPNLLNWS